MNQLLQSGRAKWLIVCTCAGLLASLWSPLVTTGASGPNGIFNPYSRLLIYMGGQLSAIPAIVFVFSKASELGYVDEKLSANVGNSSAYSIFMRMYNLPLLQKLYALSTGAMLGIGYIFNFVASELISPTIVFSISACEPLATIVVGTVVFRQLEGSDLLTKQYMLISAILFVIAITLLVLIAN